MGALKSEMDSLNSNSTKEKLHADPIDINTSLSSLAATPISFDSILQKCGHFGRFQFIHYFFINLISMSAAVAGFYYVFAVADPDPRCRLPASVWPNDTQYNPINATYQTMIDINRDGWLPLHIAIYLGYMDIVYYLLRY
ncbi:unnamed protein product [Rotaria sp. Silwood2]|nr:unnamed protein product [Rotaria sp. Silwood2]